jgi:hypothetical protein
MKHSCFFEWYNQFKEGRENVEDDEKSGRPWSHRTNEKVETMGNMVHSDRRSSISRAYVEILKRLREYVRRNRPELWPNDRILHHNNAPAYKVLSVK